MFNGFNYPTLFSGISRFPASFLFSKDKKLTQKHVNLKWTGGTVDVVSVGHPGPFPTMTLTAAASVTAGVLNIPAGGNPSRRVFGNSAIDDIFRLDQFTRKNKIKFFCTRFYRDIAGEALGAANERIFQYGDQGSSAGQTGGCVARMNFSTTSQGTIRCVTFALHWADPHGVAADDLICKSTRDLSVNNDGYTSATGHFILVAVEKDASAGNAAIHVYVDDDAVVTVTGTNGFPLPGISNVGPGNNASSNGLTLMAQSTNEGTSQLRKGSLWPMWVGEARGMNQLSQLITNLKADITISPYR